MLFGQHAVRAALANPQRHIRALWATSHSAKEIKPLLTAAHPPLTLLEPRILNQKLPRDAVHQGLVAEVAPLNTPELAEILEEQGFLLALDQITDPRNMGAILRSAAAFGVSAVLVPRHNSPAIGGNLGKAASGALEIVPIIEVANLARALESAKKAGYFVVGLAEDAPHTIDDAPVHTTAAPVLCVMGAEDKGLRRLTRDYCDMLVRLPTQMDANSFSTLNVSAAAAITLYALNRATADSQ